MKTIRQQMIDILQANPMDRRDLSQELMISEKDVDGHLPHVAKSVAAQGMIWKVTPAHCESCHYTFKDRKRFTRPGKCPRCKASRIQGPWFQVTPAASKD